MGKERKRAEGGEKIERQSASAWFCVCACVYVRKNMCVSGCVSDSVSASVSVWVWVCERDKGGWGVTDRVKLRSIWCDSWLANNNVFNGRLNELKCWSYYTTHHHHHCRYHTPSPSLPLPHTITIIAVVGVHSTKVKNCFSRFVDDNVSSFGRELWSSNYGRRFLFKISWVRIPAPDTGMTFSHLL